MVKPKPMPMWPWDANPPSSVVKKDPGNGTGGGRSYGGAVQTPALRPPKIDTSVGVIFILILPSSVSF